MNKKKSLHFGMALAMFVLFLGQVLGYSGRAEISVIVSILLLTLAVAHVILGIKKQSD
ncbi:hypothetical protein K1X84_00115 [bacterium]|nr:hypothetical protein [bacterium]